MTKFWHSLGSSSLGAQIKNTNTTSSWASVTLVHHQLSRDVPALGPRHFDHLGLDVLAADKDNKPKTANTYQEKQKKMGEPNDHQGRGPLALGSNCAGWGC